MNNLSKSFDETSIFKDVDISVYADDIIGLIGPNGVGKSTILKILTEQLPANTGTIKLGHNCYSRLLRPGPVQLKRVQYFI